MQAIDKALVIGGSNGIGLSIALKIAAAADATVAIVDKVKPEVELPANATFRQVNLLDGDYGFLDEFGDINTLVFTAGFGRVAPFETIEQIEIDNQFRVNAIAPIQVLRHYYPRMRQAEPFRCAVMGSIAGWVSSPLFALYSATKGALCKAIEAINIELEMAGTQNRVLNVSPGSIGGTRFNGGPNDLNKTEPLAEEIVRQMNARQTLFIPQFDEVFGGVLNRYRDDPHRFGIDSFRYKMEANRFNLKPQVKVGYLSGTFDLFHVGHLNLLRRAKQYCDMLVVGVHRDASHKGKETFIPFDERVKIVQSIRYVDRVIQSRPEDVDVYKDGIVKYDYLFVGSDYKGTERFNRYEEYFADKNVQIVYFPYTQGTSSTQIRNLIVSKS